MLRYSGILYNFEWFIGHASQPICADTGNIFFLDFSGFWRFVGKIKKSRGDESFEIVQ
jgi:hypothetical protein